MTRIKEHYFGFWTGGSPGNGDWYDGFASDWHGPLTPRQYARRCSEYGRNIMCLMFFVVIVSFPTWAPIFRDREMRFWVMVAAATVTLIAVTAKRLLEDRLVETTYLSFSLCPRCSTGLWTADVYRYFKAHDFAGSIQRCPNCRFEREHQLKVAPAVRLYVLK
ncbi:MAG: hypothetical protein HW405_432, partial [Candidatus Berkelbacteria bacterium]|nr:hypothetical protein [Candidatus Berkelbacteria bacterium]